MVKPMRHRVRTGCGLPRGNVCFWYPSPPRLRFSSKSLPFLPSTLHAVTFADRSPASSFSLTMYEHFLEQVNLAEQLTSGDFGVSTG
jgi:hypothetical protein